MRIFTIVLFVLLIGFYSCDFVIQEFKINNADLSDEKMITDTLFINNIILSNDTISGFSRWSEHLKDRLKDSIFYSFIRNRFDTSFMNHCDSVFYLIDTIYVQDNSGYLILSSYKVLFGEGFDRTLYLTFFNKERKHIKTYLVAKDVVSGDGLIGGSVRIMSNLTKNNILTTYCHYYGYLDIGPHIKEDSIIRSYDLNNFSLLKIDTIKHVDKIGY
jgi:hypothetical protein